MRGSAAPGRRRRARSSSRIRHGAEGCSISTTSIGCGARMRPAPSGTARGSGCCSGSSSGSGCSSTGRSVRRTACRRWRSGETTMRLCYIVHSQSHFAAPYIDHFARRGHEVHLISFTRDPLPNAVNHHPLPHDCDPTKSPLSYVRAIPQVRRLVRAIKPDLLHAHFLTSNGPVATASGFHPLVVSARGSDVHNSLRHTARRALIRYVVQHADLVNPVSEELAAKIATLGVPAAKTLCLSQGIVAARFDVARPPRTGGPVRIICTRKLHRPYQPETIVAALARLAADGRAFEMTFAADGRD